VQNGKENEIVQPPGKSIGETVTQLFQGGKRATREVKEGDENSLPGVPKKRKLKSCQEN